MVFLCNPFFRIIMYIFQPFVKYKSIKHWSGDKFRMPNWRSLYCFRNLNFQIHYLLYSILFIHLIVGIRATQLDNRCYNWYRIAWAFIKLCLLYHLYSLLWCWLRRFPIRLNKWSLHYLYNQTHSTSILFFSKSSILDLLSRIVYKCSSIHIVIIEYMSRYLG